MGKKTTDSNPDAVKSLFSAANPFRRQSQPQLPPELGLGLGPQSPDSDTKKRKRTKKQESPNPNPNPTRSSNLKKREKTEAEKPAEAEDGSPAKKRNKRKRDEVEAEYEKRKYGEEAIEEHGSIINVGKKRKAKDVDAEEKAVLKEEEGFDDEGKLLRTLFVGNLPLKVKKKAVAREFEQFGEIESVRIRSVPLVDSKTPRKGAVIKGKVNEAVDRVHAYIVFKDEQSTKAALAHNMAQVGGNHIRVDMACPPRKKLKGEPPLYERKKTVFVGNLPFDVKDEELYQLFCGPTQSENNVEAVRVIRDPQTSLGKGIAYVLFNSRDAANKVVKRNDLKIRDRQLRAYHAKSDATPLNRKGSGPKREFPREKFTGASNEKSSGGNEKSKATAGLLSYQGLRSSKSGVVKKSRLQTRAPVQENHGTKRSAGPEKKFRVAKRPAVAARKAKHGKKRKLETGTPENTHRHKKIRSK